MSGLLAVYVGEAPYSLLVDAFVTSFFFTCSLVKLLSSGVDNRLALFRFKSFEQIFKVCTSLD